MTKQSASADASSPRRWDLVALGNPCLDIVFAVDQLPTSGAKVLGRQLGHFGGGTEANVACAVARLGRSAAICGCLGSDAVAGELKASLEAFGVCTELLQVDATSSSACAITALEPSGERSIVYLPMPPAPISFGLDDVLRQARMLYLMPYDEDMLVQVSRVARQAGAQVVIDLEEAVAPDAAGMWRRIEQADLVFFNEAGFLAAVGEPPGEASLRGVQRAGPKTIVVTLGASGALAVDGDSFARQSAFAVTVADTTGAGDTFNAAFLVSRMEKMSLQQSLLFACAAASCAVTAVGARTGMPDITRVANVLAAAAN